jgi:hypothetical protein
MGLFKFLLFLVLSSFILFVDSSVSMSEDLDPHWSSIGYPVKRFYSNKVKWIILLSVHLLVRIPFFRNSKHLFKYFYFDISISLGRSGSRFFYFDNGPISNLSNLTISRLTNQWLKKKNYSFWSIYFWLLQARITDLSRKYFQPLLGNLNLNYWTDNTVIKSNRKTTVNHFQGL